MSHSGRGAESGPDPRAQHAGSQPRAGEAARRQPAPDQGASRYDHPEAQLGGADAVEKTTYLVGEGTEPDTRTRDEYAARPVGGGPNVGLWIVGGVAALIALVYAIGIFR